VPQCFDLTRTNVPVCCVSSLDCCAIKSTLLCRGLLVRELNCINIWLLFPHFFPLSIPPNPSSSSSDSEEKDNSHDHNTDGCLGIRLAAKDALFRLFAVLIQYLTKLLVTISLFHRAFFNSIMDKTPTHALFYSTLY